MVQNNMYNLKVKNLRRKEYERPKRHEGNESG